MRSSEPLTLAGPSGRGIWNSSQIAASSSSALRAGFRMTAARVPGGSCSRKQRQTVVLPVPTSPVSWTNPPSLRTP